MDTQVPFPDVPYPQSLSSHPQPLSSHPPPLSAAEKAKSVLKVTQTHLVATHKVVVAHGAQALDMAKEKYKASHTNNGKNDHGHEQHTHEKSHGHKFGLHFGKDKHHAEHKPEPMAHYHTIPYDHPHAAAFGAGAESQDGPDAARGWVPPAEERAPGEFSRAITVGTQMKGVESEGESYTLQTHESAGEVHPYHKVAGDPSVRWTTRVEHHEEEAAGQHAGVVAEQHGTEKQSGLVGKSVAATAAGALVGVVGGAVAEREIHAPPPTPVLSPQAHEVDGAAEHEALDGVKSAEVEHLDGEEHFEGEHLEEYSDVEEHLDGEHFEEHFDVEEHLDDEHHEILSGDEHYHEIHSDDEHEEHSHVFHSIEEFDEHEEFIHSGDEEEHLQLATHGSLPAGTHDELLENGHGELSGDEHSHEIHSEDEFAEHEEYVHSDDEEEHLQLAAHGAFPAGVEDELKDGLETGEE